MGEEIILDCSQARMLNMEKAIVMIDDRMSPAEKYLEMKGQAFPQRPWRIVKILT
jgi:hypothetical protein